MRRAGQAQFKKARRERLRFVRENIRLFGLMTLGYASAVVLALLFGWHRELIIGAAVVGFCWLIWASLEKESSSRNRIDGAFGEQWTGQRLKRSRRKGWRSVDDIPFEHENVDHVAYGPYGVIAIETKYTSFPWSVTPIGLIGTLPGDDPLAQAIAGARKIELLLRSKHIKTSVRAALALWGPGAPDRAATFCKGVLVLAGRNAREWKELPDTGVRLSDGEVNAIDRALAEFIKMRKRHRGTPNPQAASLGTAVGRS